MSKRKTLWELIEKADFAVMTSVSKDNKLVARPMATQDNIDDGCMYFFTERDSEKIDELRKDSRVNLSYTDEGWVSVSGKAEVVSNLELKKKLWDESVKTMFAKEVDDPSVVLLRVKPETAEYWESDGVFKSTLEVITSKFNDEKPDLGESETLDI